MRDMLGELKVGRCSVRIAVFVAGVGVNAPDHSAPGTRAAMAYKVEALTRIELARHATLGRDMAHTKRKASMENGRFGSATRKLDIMVVAIEYRLTTPVP
jgi:hypothetical protein